MFRFSVSPKDLVAKASVLFLTVLFAQAIPSLNAANPVGTVHAVSVYAYGTVPGAARTALFQNDSVFSGQLVETVEKGGMTILFNDGTEFRLGSAARMTLDKFVYSSKENKGTLAINMMSGMFRFTTGKINKEGVQLKTPVATIGIRGTDFGVAVEKGTGNTIVQVFTGAVAVKTTSAANATPALVKAGEYITVTAQGAAIHPAPYFFAPPTVGPSAAVISAESDDRGDGNTDSQSAPAEPPAKDPPNKDPKNNDDDD